MNKKKIILAIILCAINLFLVEVFKIKIAFQQILIIHIFLLSLTVLSNTMQKKLVKIKNTTPFHILSVNFLRILMCVVFLYLVSVNHKELDKIYIYNFFVFYFFYLFYYSVAKNRSGIKINI